MLGLVACTVPFGGGAAFGSRAPTEPQVSRTAGTLGPTTGGERVAVTGRRLGDVTSIQFGDVAGTDLVVVDDTRLLVTTPAQGAGPVSVRAIAPAGTSVTGPSYTYVTPPTITNVTPPLQTIAGGTTVTVTGAHFTHPDLGQIRSVRFDGVNGTNLVVVDDTTLTVTTPSHAAGAGRVRLIGPGATSARSTAARFRFADVPAISDPLECSTGEVTILLGSAFTGATAVQFDTTDVTSFTVDSDTSISVTCPRMSVGAHSMYVTTPVGTSPRLRRAVAVYLFNDPGN